MEQTNTISVCNSASASSDSIRAIEPDVEQNPPQLSANALEDAVPAPIPPASQQQSGWDGPDDPENPYNWPFWYKIVTGLLYSLGQLVTLMSASMIAPALPLIAADLHMTASTAQLSFSVYFLGLGFAPFLVGPLCELFGRKPVWAACNVWYILWNALCPVGNSQAMLVIGRLMAAAGASAGVTLTGPVMADLFTAKDRGMSQAIAGLLPYLGPALGPIVGGLIAQHINWPWLFYILSIADTAVLLVGIVVLRESYTPVLLQRKAKKQTGGTAPVKESRREFQQRLYQSLARPVHILLRRPIIQVLSLVLGLDFGIYTFVLGSYATLYIDRYGESATTSSLHYIAIALGAVLCSQVGGPFMDWLWAAMQRRYPDREPVPEWRVPHMVPGAIFFPLALFWYGWAAEYGVTWPVVDVAVVFFVFWNFMLNQGPNAYMIDEFGDHAASAMAACRMFTYVLGFAFPLFAPQLYKSLGYGWGNSLLAFLFYLFGLPIIAALWYRGAKLRILKW